ncbi:MAG: hydantoinase/carbamoylase family amidase [Actinomycetota bacterium]|nr:hydantoinase/carbamoylase family amidase [Actinomycetota bacterium]
MGAELDGERLLSRLAALAASAPAAGGSGVSRLAWSPQDLEARAALRRWVAHPGIVVTTDAVGNVLAEWPGRVTGAAPVVMGSHLDTVATAGALDGAYGTVAAFEIVAALARAGERLRHPVRAVAWANEEGVVAPPFTGSRAVAGKPIDLDAVGADRRTLAERLAAAGDDPDGVRGCAWPPIAGYLELHIEQGPVLDDQGVAIGVVTAITSDRRGTVSVSGRSNHAGTTPMSLRCDALVAAAPLVATVEQLATRGPASVATVGSLVVGPGNGNVVPDRVILTYDIRSIDDGACDEAVERLRVEAGAVAAARGVTVTVTPTSSSPSVPTSAVLRAAIGEAAAGLSLSTVELPSGAGHDAQHLATLGPIGMVFVPSVGGVSHHPAEATAPEALVAGARTLLAALRLIDQRLDP